MPETRNFEESVGQRTGNVLHISGQDSLNVNGNGSPEKQTFDLSRLKISPEVIKLLPAEFVKRNRVLPIRMGEGRIHVATASARKPAID